MSKSFLIPLFHLLNPFLTNLSSSPVSPPRHISPPPSPRPQPPSHPHPPPLAPAAFLDTLPPRDASPAPCAPPDLPIDIPVDDDTLSALEKIYLFCRSKAPIHRVFIARSLHTFLPSVSPAEAVEYILPLLNGLAVDDDDAVKEALVVSLVPVMWWFFQNCQLVEDESPEEQRDPPLLPVHTFTPILGSLLIDHNSMVGGPARFAVVDILNRLHTADEIADDRPPFGCKERRFLEQEIVHQVIIGMGRLDLSEDLPSPLSKPEHTPALASPDNIIHTLPSHEQQSQASFALAVLPPSPPSLISESPCNNPSKEVYDSLDDGWLVAENRDSRDLQDDANEQAAIGRLSSMSLIATVTAHAKLPEDTIRTFADEVAYICGDPLYWVRREASFALGALAKVVPTEVVHLSLLPLFEALTQDPVWHVRHSALFALPGILTRLTPPHRRALALKTLLPLATDAALTVRSGVLEVLGEVIYAFHQDEDGVPEELVGLFVGRKPDRDSHQDEPQKSLAQPPAKVKKPPSPLISVFDHDDDEEEDQSESNEVGRSVTQSLTFDVICRDPARALVTSFNYPAVALSLGPRRWGEVRQYYLTLTRERDIRVRRTIAAGLGEMARILGSDLAVRDLVDVWQDMVHDFEDGQTRQKALDGLCPLVGALDCAARESVVAGLVELWERWLTGWRERESLTRALPTLATLAVGQGEVVRTLMGKALADSVAAVRDAAIGVLIHVLRAYERRPHLAEALRDDLRDLACADSSRRRATYVECHCALVECENGKAEVDRDEFWKQIIRLSQDTVADVRIAVARLVGIICDKFYPHDSSRPLRVSYTIRQLCQDPCRDVRAFVTFLAVAGQARTSPRPMTPPMMYATFSRPPSKLPPLDVMMAGMRDDSADILMGWAVQEGDWDPAVSRPTDVRSPRRKEDNREQDGTRSEDRVRLDDFEYC